VTAHLLSARISVATQRCFHFQYRNLITTFDLSNTEWNQWRNRAFLFPHRSGPKSVSTNTKVAFELAWRNACWFSELGQSCVERRLSVNNVGVTSDAAYSFGCAFPALQSTAVMPRGVGTYTNFVEEKADLWVSSHKLYETLRVWVEKMRPVYMKSVK